jgi:hypothetical protein
MYQKDIRKGLNELHKDISSIVFMQDNSLQVTYYKHKDIIKELVLAFLHENGLNSYFKEIKIVHKKDKEKERQLRRYKKQRKVNRDNGSNCRVGTLESRDLRKNGLKYCPMCKTVKRLDEFNKSTQKRNLGNSTHCTLCSRKLSKKYIDPVKNGKRYIKDKDRWHSYRLKNKFGINLDDYNNMLKKQNGVCAICGITEQENGKRFAVDHNHTTNEIRDLLCSRCNAAIGFLQENIQITQNVIKYLKRWSK